MTEPYLLAVIIAGMLVCGLAASSIRSKMFDPLSPLSVVAFCIVMGYLIPIRAFIAGEDYFSTIWRVQFADFGSALSSALKSVGLAVAAFSVAYGSTQRRRGSDYTANLIRFQWSRRRLFVLSSMMTTTAIVMYVAGVSRVGGFTAIMDGLNNRTRLFQGNNIFFLPTVSMLAVSLTWYCYYATHSRRPVILYWVYVLGSILLAATLANRATIAVFVMSMLVLHHRLVRPIRLAHACAVAALLLVAIALYGVFAREYLVLGYISSIGGRESGVRELSEVVLRDIDGNFAQLQVLTAIQDASRSELPLQMGRTFGATLTLLVPSALWQAKPLTAAGVVTLNLWPAKWLYEGTTVPPGLIGELFLNFANAGVVVGMLVVGRAYGIVARRVQRSTVSPKDVLVYAISVGLLPHLIRGETGGPFVLMFMLVVPALILVYWSVRPLPVEIGVTGRP